MGYIQLPGVKGLYYFGLDMRDYVSAGLACQQHSHGAHLAVIRNEGEQVAIANHILEARYGL